MIAKQRWADDLSRDLSLAWHTALFTRQEKLPPLSKVLERRTAARPQTVSQQRTVLQAISEAYKLPMRKTKLSLTLPKG